MKKIFISSILVCSLFYISTPVYSKDMNQNIQIIVVNEEQEKLENISLSLQKENEKSSTMYTSNADGMIQLENLEMGTYIIKIKKGRGYELKKEVDFEITPYTYQNGFKLTITLQKKMPYIAEHQNYSLIILFTLCIGGILGFAIYFFRKYTFTQFFNDFMI